MAGFRERLTKKFILLLYGKRVNYYLPEMEQVEVRRDLLYKTVEDENLLFNLYRPPGLAATARPPVVLIIHGNAPQDAMRHAKDWGANDSWARLLAASGAVAVTFNYRPIDNFANLPNSSADVADLVNFLRLNAADFALDPERFGVLAFSAGVPLGMWLTMAKPAPYLRCAVGYYGAFDLQHLRPLLPDLISNELLDEFSAINHLEKAASHRLPILVVRAGFDAESLNGTIARFVQRARIVEAPVRLVNFPHGQHGFDILNKSANTKSVIEETLNFLKYHLDLTSPAD